MKECWRSDEVLGAIILEIDFLEIVDVCVDAALFVIFVSIYSSNAKRIYRDDLPCFYQRSRCILYYEERHHTGGLSISFAITLENNEN